MPGMDRAAVITAIRAREPLFRQHGITHVWLFGSVARDEAGPGSDVDLFFDHDIPDLTAFGYVGLKHLAQDNLPFAVDFISRGALDRRIRPRIEAEAVQVF